MWRWWLESPPAPGEDGASAHAKDDVHRQHQLSPALLHQHDLSDREAWSGEHHPDRLRQAEGGEAPVLDDEEELQEVILELL
jgi:hypothetical protein